jgi:hypothetical protein
MTTFSELVDKMVLETKRPDLRSEICTYLNQSVREVHFEPEHGNVVFYSSNYREELLTADTESQFYWDAPSVANFQGIARVRFNSAYNDQGRQQYAKEMFPGPRFESEPYAYYRVGHRFIFGGARGYGGIGANIAISWFEYPPALKYYQPADRPATYDVESGFTYKLDFNDTDEHREDAQRKTTNWLLLRWFTVIEEGLRAKVYKRLSDDSRARTSYSLYGQLRQGLYTSEIADMGGFY